MTTRKPGRKLPELLAPAGGFEQLRYALHFGADAVYLACDKFGLRQRAQNFSLEDIPRAVRIAHNANAKVYVTLNSYLHDSDLADLPAYLQALEAAEVDAVIVSDLGVLAAARRYAPSVDIHVSTQASVSNAEAVRLWHELGAKRIVTAREMSLAEIAALKREVPEVELEVFVQGAMCMAISGRCLISDFLTGRSANQGNCVQPCRWSYRLEEETRPGEFFPVEEDDRGTYLMNSKDLNMLAHLDELIAAGVDSIKIEGRVKKAFYVATVVNAYRHVLDGEDPARWASELDRISHRPYSTGFFFGDAQQSFADDIYVQLYDWVAEVIGSEPLSQASERAHFQPANPSQSMDSMQPSNLALSIQPANPSQSLDSLQQPSNLDGLWRTVVKCRNRFYEGDVLELLSPHDDVMPILVVGLEEVFFEDPSDADAPACAHGSPDSDAAILPIANTIPVDVANKAMGVYALVTPMPLHRYDILRAKRRDPSKKN